MSIFFPLRWGLTNSFAWAGLELRFSRSQPSTQPGVTNMCRCTSYWLRWGFANFLPELALNCHPPNSASWVARTTGTEPIHLHTWSFIVWAIKFYGFCHITISNINKIYYLNIILINHTLQININLIEATENNLPSIVQLWSGRARIQT
jgi:hypothetical protein